MKECTLIVPPLYGSYAMVKSIVTNSAKRVPVSKRTHPELYEFVWSNPYSMNPVTFIQMGEK